MTKKQFIKILENELVENGVKNIKEVLNEYENHFEEGKIAGKSEDEISQSLGSPEMIASEYTNSVEKNLEIKKTGKNFEKILAITICSVVLVIALLVLVPVISRKLDDRTVTIKYDQNELSLMSVEEGKKIVDSLENVEVMWVMPDGEQIYTDGFKNYTFEYKI